MREKGAAAKGNSGGVPPVTDDAARPLEGTGRGGATALRRGRAAASGARWQGYMVARGR